MPPMMTVRPLMRARRTIAFGLRSVVRMARAALASAVAAEAIEQSRDRLDDAVDGKRASDDSGRADEDFMNGNAQCCGRRPPQCVACRGHARTAGAGVRVAAVDENGTPDAVAQMQAVERDRCRDDLIGREHAGDRAAAVRDDQREIE